MLRVANALAVVNDVVVFVIASYVPLYIVSMAFLIVAYIMT